MGIKTVYVEGASKKDINARLIAGENVQEIEFALAMVTYHTLRALPAGTVVKIYSQFSGGIPVAKAYGNITFDKKTGQVKIK